MIRLNSDTPNDILQDVKIGDMVTDTFSKTGLVENIENITNKFWLLCQKEVAIIECKDEAVKLTIGRKSKYFYDVKTGLRVATENESGEGAQKRKTMTYYADYVEVKGVKFPYKTTMDVGMPLEFITQDVKINEGVTDKDFE